jgi:phage terminase Nu1 subunit (DNA packaging protein)
MSDNTCDIATLAKLLDTTEDEINGLVKEGTLSEKSKGRFVPLQAVAEYIKHLRNAPAGGRIVDGELCVNFDTVVKIFNIVPSTFVRWMQKGCPKKDKGLYSIAAIMRWRGEASPDQLAGEGEELGFKSLGEAKSYYEGELKKAQTLLANWDYSVKTGQYIKADVIRTELEKVITNCRSRLLALPSKAASELVGVTKQAEIQEAVKQMVYTALEELVVPDFSDGNEKGTGYNISGVQDLGAATRPVG